VQIDIFLSFKLPAGVAGNLVVTEKSATPTKCVSRVSGNQTESGRTTGSGNWTKPFSDSIKNWFNIITQLSQTENSKYPLAYSRMFLIHYCS